MTAATATAQIAKTPGVCGGDACILGTRISVWGLVAWRKLGLSDAAIIEGFPGLSPHELQAAWQYADEYSAEIEEAIRRNAEA